MRLRGKTVKPLDAEQREPPQEFSFCGKEKGYANIQAPREEKKKDPITRKYPEFHSKLVPCTLMF